MNNLTRRNKIRKLNDELRKRLQGGVILLTAGVSDLPDAEKSAVLLKVIAFDDFAEANDPYGERDFGSFVFQSDTFFWKIDYYDPTMTHGSSDPADPTQTTRVLTIMRAEEY